MSVENQTGEQEIAVKQIGIRNPSNTNCQSSENPETMERPPISTTNPHVPIIANITENESSPSGRSEMRDWMENMDGLERTCALAFVDGSFWTALLSFASWSKAPTTTSGGPSKYSNDLSTILRLVPASARRSAIPGTLNDEDSFHSTFHYGEEQPTSLMHGALEYNVCVYFVVYFILIFSLCQDKQIDWTATVDIDAFVNSMLGRRGEILSESSTEHSNAENEEEVVTNTSVTGATIEKRGISELVDSNALRIPREDILKAEEVSLGDINLISSIFNDTCLVFPSAFRQFYSDFKDEKSPAVVVAHLFDETDWQQAFSAFDQVFTHSFGSGFLTDVNFSQVSTESLLLSRLERVKKTNTQVPLVLIFLLRLEVAAVVSFKDEQDETSARLGSAPRLRKLLPQLLSSETTLPSNTGGDSCLGPFLSTFCIPNDFAVDINTLLLTPLNLLSFAMGSARDYDWVALDHAISSSLVKIETMFPSGEEANIRLSNGTGTESKHHGATSSTQDTEPVQQKKKRKSRKRKVCIRFDLLNYFSLLRSNVTLSILHRERRKVFRSRSKSSRQGM